ncbi:MAG: DUF4296 domain-containing protein [Bacteroidetes bacterium]|nr:DUF4296 domain-containing protein [Bacteroidota bacterium]
MKIVHKLFFVGILSVVLIACSNSDTVNEQKPTFSKDTIVNTMVDIHILEAQLTLGLLKQEGDSNQVENIYKKNGITKKYYEDALAYYAQHPVEMVAVYDEVINELSKRQAKESQ